MTFKLYQDPGPSPKVEEITKGDFEYAMTMWQGQYALYAFQQNRIRSAIEAEEKRQENIIKFNMDAVECTKKMHQKQHYATRIAKFNKMDGK